MIAPTILEALGDLISAVSDAGILVIVSDSGAKTDDFAAFLTANNEAGGRTAADAILYADGTISLRHGTECRSVPAAGDPGAAHHLDRLYAEFGSGRAGSRFAGLSRLNVASPSMTNAYELQAIAAAVVDGASLFGGRGTVAGAVAGAMLFTTMRNGAELMDIDPFWEMLLEGLLIALVVYLDNLQKKRLNGT